jgi:lon-related putative ATP-dependent protease
MQPLGPQSLRPRCEPGQFAFNTTAELETLEEILGQERALDALNFGISIEHEGYNLYVIGQPGVGKYAVTRRILEKEAASKSRPVDWCYLNNFDDPAKPLAVSLPPGSGLALKRDLERLIQELRTAIPAAFESDTYRARVNAIEEEFKQQQEDTLAEVQKQAEAQQMAILHTPGGFGVAPLKDGEIITPEEFQKLPESERRRIEEIVSQLKSQLTKVLLQTQNHQKERKKKAEQLNREIATSAIEGPLDELRQNYSKLPVIQDHLNRIQADILENLTEFGEQSKPHPNPLGMPTPPSHFFRRYQVNLIVDQSLTKGVPVIFEDNPSFQNLIGRVEYLSQLGTLVTDFTQIKPGALHRANGGYLILEVRKLLTEPYAWHGLKRALKSGHIVMESLGQLLGLVSTASLEPQPIALNVKVVLLGDYLLYYLLCEFDPDFKDLVKVAAEFEDEIHRNELNTALYARLIATLVRRYQLLPFDRTAVAHVIDHSARMAQDSAKLSIHMRRVTDLLTEANHWAQQAGKQEVKAEHVKQAVGKKIYRLDRVRERIYEAIQRGILLIATQGERVGQINGLSVLQTGDFMFGQPTRITATARLGKGEVIDIQREVELGGAIHSKGVLILSAFLGARYAGDFPLSLSASLVFEQTYGMVEGDSASVAELCVLLSALSSVPIKQSLAITGSVNQHGQIQAIGGVNEKIEAFFDICKQRGLTGDQGVLIPRSNTQHLMLREDVVDAVTAGDFQVYAIDTVDQAVELLTGQPAGVADSEGRFPPASVNAKVEGRLRELSQVQEKFAALHQGRGGNER